MGAVPAWGLLLLDGELFRLVERLCFLSAIELCEFIGRKVESFGPVRVCLASLLSDFGAVTIVGEGVSIATPGVSCRIVEEQVFGLAHKFLLSAVPLDENSFTAKDDGSYGLAQHKVYFRSVCHFERANDVAGFPVVGSELVYSPEMGSCWAENDLFTPGFPTITREEKFVLWFHGGYSFLMSTGRWLMQAEAACPPLNFASSASLTYKSRCLEWSSTGQTIGAPQRISSTQ